MSAGSRPIRDSGNRKARRIAELHRLRCQRGSASTQRQDHALSSSTPALITCLNVNIAALHRPFVRAHQDGALWRSRKHKRAIGSRCRFHRAPVALAQQPNRCPSYRLSFRIPDHAAHLVIARSSLRGRSSLRSTRRPGPAYARYRERHHAHHRSGQLRHQRYRLVDPRQAFQPSIFKFPALPPF